MNSFLIGFSALFKGISFSLKHFRIWFLVPITLWLVLTLGISFQLSKWLVPYFLELIESTTGMKLANESIADSWTKFLKIGISWGVIIVIKILIWYVLSRYLKYLILVLLSPLFAFLSEKTEEKISGKTYSFSFRQFFKDVIRGIGITCRNLMIETGLIVIGSIISFFLPILAPVIIILLFLINCYFMAFNFFDYVAERKRMSISESVKFMRSNKVLLIGFGVAYNIVAWIPLLDWVLAPISAASGAVIAELEVAKKEIQ
ncbi:MAG: EI24 domain-containing protein [Crocinitomicaceae bacterium]